MKSGSVFQRTARESASARSRSWQQRRSDLLQEACIFIAGRIANGAKVGQAIKEASRKFRNRSLGNGRALNLSRKTAERVYYDSVKRGDSAFALHYVAGRQHKIDPLLLQLVVQAAILQSKSVREILAQADFSDRKGRPSKWTLDRALPTREVTHFLRAERRLLTQRKRTEKKIVDLQKQLRGIVLRAESRNAARQKRIEKELFGIQQRLRALRAEAEAKFLTKGPGVNPPQRRAAAKKGNTSR